MSIEPGTWSRVRAVFEGALALDPAERVRFLDGACGEDVELRASVEQLIRSDTDRDAILQPLWHMDLDVFDPRADAVQGRRIGPYAIERVIGHGGMGTVYLARRADEHFQKRVALKLVRRGMDTDDILRRFRNERQVLADLEHPGIARLLDGGATEDGRPYLVMEYVEGVPLDRHCAERHPDLRERLELFVRISEAVQHAHERHIVHRDLKPSNILVTADGAPKLLDFGIAKVLDLSGSSSTADLTVTEQRLMTLEYASPEQIRGGTITTASDVYSLGVVLYELVAGRRPFGATVRQRAELERQILEDEPLRPSAAVREPGNDARRPGGATTGRLRRALRGDLDTIVLMALRKEPERRYPSVAELAEDMSRWLAGRPVLARRDTWRYRSAKFVRRNRILVGATLAVVLSLAAGLIVSLDLFLETESEHQRGTEREYEADLAAATLALRQWNVADARRWLQAAPESLRGWEWRHLWSRCDRSVATLRGPERALRAVAWSPDGRWIASGDEARAVHVWDARTGAEWAAWRELSNVIALAFSRDGSRLAALVEGKHVRVWDVERRELTEAPESAGVPLGIDYGPSSLWIASRSSDQAGVIQLSGLSTRETELQIDALQVYALAFTPDGRSLLATLVNRTNQKDSRVRLWDLGDGSVLDRALDALPSTALCLDPDGRRAGVPLSSGVTVVLDLASGASEVLRIRASEAGVRAVAFSPDGRILATGSTDGAIRTWDAATGAELGLLLGHDPPVTALAFSPDGSRIVSGAMDETVKLWDPRTVDVRTIRGDAFWSSSLSVSPDGARIATGAYDPRSGLDGVVVWDSSTGAPLWRRAEWKRDPQHGGTIDARWSPSGAELAVGLMDGTFLLLDVERGRTLREWRAQEMVSAVAFQPGGHLLATGGPDSIRLWDAGSCELVRELPHKKGSRVGDLGFSPDGRLLLAVGQAPAELWKVESGELLAALGAVEQRRGVFRPDGKQAATASFDGTISLWRIPEGTLDATLRGHAARVYGVTYSPDGKRLASGSLDTTVKIWDPDSARELVTLYGHHARVDRVAFTPDGQCLMSIDLDGVIKLWEAPEDIRR